MDIYEQASDIYNDLGLLHINSEYDGSWSNIH